MLAIALSPIPAQAAPFYGIARAKDGDSLMVGETEVRLFGIDAPEFTQTCKRGSQNWSCGSEAANRLSRLFTGKDDRCVSMGIDQHDRTVGRCTVGTTDINRTMVATGYAVAFRRFSTDYVSAEESAKTNRRGIWAGTFEMPSDVRDAAKSEFPTAAPIRRSESRASSPMSRVSTGCSIKGNRGSNGWIYHLPGMPYYGKTVAEEMFCTEAAARAAGYRRAKVR